VLRTASLAVALLACLAAGMMFGVPAAKEALDDYDTAIPVLTVLVIEASGPIALAVLGLVALELAAMVVFLRRWPRVVAMAATFVVVLAMVVGAVGVLALAVPILKLSGSVA